MKEKIRHLNELNSMPKEYLNVMRNRVTINMMDGGITNHPAYANLKGVQPRGWPEGDTWDIVAGVGGHDSLGLGDSHMSNDARSLAIHEAMHSVASQTGFNSNPEFLSYFNRDKGRPNSKDYNGVYRTSYPEEYLAMAVDEYYCSPATKALLKEYYPNAFEMVEKIFIKVLLASGKASDPPGTVPEPTVPTPTPATPKPKDPIVEEPVPGSGNTQMDDEPVVLMPEPATDEGGMSKDAEPDPIHKNSKPKASFNSCN